MARHGRHGPPRAAVRVPSAPATEPFGFSRNMRHETRITAFFRITAPLPTISHHFPRFPGISRHFPPPPTPLRRSSVHAPSAFLGQPPGTAAPARSLLSCALWCGMGRLWRGMGGRRTPRRQHGLSVFSSHEIGQHAFSQSLRRLQGEQPQARPTGFHESRNTAFILRLFFFYSGDRHEPRRVHVARDDRAAKFWLDPARMQRNGGLRHSEILRVQQTIEENHNLFMEAGIDDFND